MTEDRASAKKREELLIDRVAAAIMGPFIKKWFLGKYKGPVYFDCVNGEKAWTSEAKSAIDAVLSFSQAPKAGMTIERIDVAFAEFRKTLTVMDTRPDHQSFAQGYVAGWNAQGEDVPAAGSQTRDELVGSLLSEISALKEHIKIHAGDTISLSGEIDMWRERALEAEEALALERIAVEGGKFASKAIKYAYEEISDDFERFEFLGCWLIGKLDQWPAFISYCEDAETLSSTERT